MVGVSETVEQSRERRPVPAWLLVLHQELRDLWLGGRGFALSFAFSILVSVIAYLVATSTDFNFLEQRESASLTLEVGVAVGGLLALLASADAVSGERERGTLETLLLTPAPRGHLAGGKLCAALSLWLAAFVITIPYVWLLGREVGIVVQALEVGLLVGTLLAIFLASLGFIVSLFASSNRVSLSLSLFLLFAFFAPTQLPSGVDKAWTGELLIHVNPVIAGEHYIGKIVVNGHAWTEDASLLISPVVAAIVSATAAILLAGRFLRLRGGVSR